MSVDDIIIFSSDYKMKACLNSFVFFCLTVSSPNIFHFKKTFSLKKMVQLYSREQIAQNVILSYRKLFFFNLIFCAFLYSFGKYLRETFLILRKVSFMSLFNSDVFLLNSGDKNILMGLMLTIGSKQKFKKIHIKCVESLVEN